MSQSQIENQESVSSGKLTVILLVTLIALGVLFFMSFIFFVKFKAYQTVAQDLKAELKHNYNGYLTLNYNIVDNAIIMSNYNYEQSIKTLSGIFPKIECDAKQSCLINGIYYHFNVTSKNGYLMIIGYQADLSKDEQKIADNSFVMHQQRNKNF
ncbi:hypothetical protein [Fastidiosibacter lacustris]|uniref:hypothetical protein n=1 Tax=Fastidiosibacter lacustris TaxID=2056695 RepID=UPI000E345E8F|nr:hypothetical protein [Fastidiosibacter lacustris]